MANADVGSGRVFPVREADITCERFDIPDHWVRLGGMDFGWDHPFAAVELVWDRDGDVMYVTSATDCVRLPRSSTLQR